MKDPRCMIGRHEWHTKLNIEREPYEICGRPGCGKIRKTGSAFDVGGESPGPQPQGPGPVVWSVAARLSRRPAD